MSRPAISLSRPIVQRSFRFAAVAVATMASGAAVASIASGRAPSAPSVKTVTVADSVYVPDKVKIHKGQEVKWIWSASNDMPHNVTMTAGPKGVKAKNFTSKTRVRNYVFERKFTVPGKYVFHCTIHYFMVITVIVSK